MTMTQQQDLFYREEFVEKTAGEVDLPDDPNQWAQQILQELYKQVPYITDYQPHVQMHRVDAERGYGLGHVEIQNQTEAPMDTDQQMLEATGIRTVRIPFVIREKKLSPFDLIVNDLGKVIPLTENRLRQALFRPQAFDVTSRTPGDQSMIGQLYPPYRQNYGFGGGGISMNAAGGMGMGKVGSALEAYLDPSQYEAEKRAAVLTTEAREKIKPKNFAVSSKKSDTGEPKYPINDPKHARNALTRVRQFGTPAEKSQVYSAVSKKYPALATRSEVIPEKKQRTAEKKLGLGKGEESQKAEKAVQKVGSILQAILPTITRADHERFTDELSKSASYLLSVNSMSCPEFQGILADIVNTVPEQVKEGSWRAWCPPTVVQVRHTQDGYLVKRASHIMWDPEVEVVDRGEVVRRFGVKMAMEADTTGSATAADEAEAVGEEKDRDLEQITDPGLYKVVDSKGKEHVGFVVPQLIDTDGKLLPLALFTNGTVMSLQSDIFGERSGDGMNLPSGPVGKNGAFYTVDEEGVKMTVPFEFQDSYEVGGQPKVWQGQTFDGRPISVSAQPNVKTVVPVDTKSIIVPENWRWLPLDGVESISLVSSEEASAFDKIEEKVSCVQVVSDGTSFSFRGVPVTKLANSDTHWLSLDDAMFLLGGLGVDLGHGAKKLAEAAAFSKEASIRVGRVIYPYGEQVKSAQARAREIVNGMASFKQPLLLKEAATFPDPSTVDTILSLGFINPENIVTFVSYLPDLESVQSKLCEILFSVRLGLKSIPQAAVERAVRSLEETIEGLKVLGFQGS